MKIPQSVTKFVGKKGLVLKKYSPEILLGAGLVGVTVAAVLACKATLEAQNVIEEHQEKLDQIDKAIKLSKEYSENDMRKDQAIVYIQTGSNLAVLYAPAVSTAVISVACILAGHRILRTRNLALAAAYKLVEQSFAEYRDRVITELGAAKDFHFRYNTQEYEVTETETDENGKKTKIKKLVQTLKSDQDYSMYARLFEPQVFNPDGSWTGSSQFSRVHDYNYNFLSGKLNWLNDRLHAQGYLFLSDVYDELGFPRTKASQIVGWLADGEGDGYISFGKAMDYLAYEDGDPILIDFNVDGPILDFMEGG